MSRSTAGSECPALHREVDLHVTMRRGQIHVTEPGFDDAQINAGL
jgi:hypothetical protein